jgi:hypothetical protein
VLITAAAGGLGHFAVQMARALGAVVIATASPPTMNWCTGWVRLWSSTRPRRTGRTRSAR